MATSSDERAGTSLGLLRDMRRVRSFEERCAELYGERRIRGFLHLSVGQEAVAAGILGALGDSDSVVSTHRDHAHALLRGVSARSIMAEMFGRTEGCSGGRGGSMHLFDSTTRFYGGNAIVGGQIPFAVGLALADQLSRRDGVTACFFGEGAVAEGEFHEGLNLAALWRLPVLFCCENNLYAMGTLLDRSEAQTDLLAKAASYAVPARTVDGMDVLAVRDATEDALGEIRGGGGPRFLELRTYRYRGHSMFDPELYRDDSEVDQWRERDPIVTFTARLTAEGVLDDAELTRLAHEIDTEIEDAVVFAEKGSFEPVSELARHTYRRETNP